MESPTVGNAQKKSAHGERILFCYNRFKYLGEIIHKGISTALDLTKLFYLLSATKYL